MSAAYISPEFDVTSAFKVKPFDAPLGAEILDLDLTRTLPQDEFARVHRAHLDHHLLVFRDQGIDKEGTFGSIFLTAQPCVRLVAIITWRQQTCIEPVGGFKFRKAEVISLTVLILKLNVNVRCIYRNITVII